MEIENTYRAGNQIETSFSVLCGRIGIGFCCYRNRIELCEVPRGFFCLSFAVEKEAPGH